MPFTLAHPAAAVPLQKVGLPLSALVVGSMAPDFPYFLHKTVEDHYAHTAQGLFLFCIPAGLLVLWLFHHVLKFPLLWLLPSSHQARIAAPASQFRFGPTSQFLRVVLALFVGACTHIVWDSFTHASGWSVQQLPPLRLPLIQISGSTLYVFKALQHGSTVVGASLLLFWYLRWFKQAPMQAVALPVEPADALKRRLLVLMSATAFSGAVAFGYAGTTSFMGIGWIQPFARLFVVRGIAILFAELLIFSALWHLRASPKSLA